MNIIKRTEGTEGTAAGSPGFKSPAQELASTMLSKGEPSEENSMVRIK